MTTFTNISNNPILVSGTHLQGFINNISYDELAAALGEHNEGDAYKTDVEFDLQFDDGTVATIYNYKDGPNYKGHGSLSHIKTWHVGGKSIDAVLKVADALGLVPAGSANPEQQSFSFAGSLASTGSWSG